MWREAGAVLLDTLFGAPAGRSQEDTQHKHRGTPCHPTPPVQHRGTGARQPPHTQHRDRGRGGRSARRGRFLRLPRHEQERQCAEGLGDEPGRDRCGRRHRPAVGGVHQAGQGAGRLRRHQGLPGLHERKPGARCGRPRHERVPAPAVPGQLQRAEQEEPAAARRCGDLPARPVFGVRRRQAQVHRPSQLPAGSTVAIPNDETNQARALGVLKAAGLITLKGDWTAFTIPQDVDTANSRSRSSP